MESFGNIMECQPYQITFCGTLFSPILYSWLQCNRIHSGLRSGIVVLATGEVLSAATRSTATRKLACIFFLMAILLSGIQCRGLLCFIFK